MDAGCRRYLVDEPTGLRIALGRVEIRDDGNIEGLHGLAVRERGHAIAGAFEVFQHAGTQGAGCRRSTDDGYRTRAQQSDDRGGSSAHDLSRNADWSGGSEFREYAQYRRRHENVHFKFPVPL